MDVYLLFTSDNCFKCGFHKNISYWPEDQTEEKFLIISLKQVFDRNHFKCEFYKKSS